MNTEAEIVAKAQKNNLRFCHPERSEGSLCRAVETLHFVQGDTKVIVLQLLW